MNKTLRVPNVRFLVLVALLLMAAMVLPALAASNKWRVSLDGKSKVQGEITLAFVPEGGMATLVVVAIPAHTSENHAAVLVRDAVRKTFGEVYHVEVDDSEDVLVKVRGKTPDFDLAVSRDTAEGLRVKLHKE